MEGGKKEGDEEGKSRRGPEKVSSLVMLKEGGKGWREMKVKREGEIRGRSEGMKMRRGGREMMVEREGEIRGRNEEKGREGDEGGKGRRY
ncbi:hypothetical protein Pcinc_043480 [Petrolisthes cinctipes]|uniref:Uncharacterized protein n=1 Tax=Petrolisthes cinctipes TaxID=88211 RepID=A0AAE1EG23_PETCI|nr:hypothetical protein Pcinc_043480 [Petrolisthes cinctipes]